MSEPFVAACIQLTAGREIPANLEIIGDLARRARAAGADVIGLPENAVLMEPKRDLLRAKAAPEESHAAVAALSALAEDTGAWLVVGSVHVALPSGMIANRSLVIDPKGGIRARYDKIHMFDVDLGNGEAYRESATFAPGTAAVTVDLPWAKLGLSICYDLRFPHLYRRLAQGGALVLTVPAAFTVPTGRAHWHVLLRARAIETGCYVLAPAQVGTHAEGRKTYGHALIVDPWGEVLADAGEEPGFITARIDPAAVREARGKVPSLSHDRDFTGP